MKTLAVQISVATRGLTDTFSHPAGSPTPVTQSASGTTLGALPWDIVPPSSVQQPLFSLLMASTLPSGTPTPGKQVLHLLPLLTLAHMKKSTSAAEPSGQRGFSFSPFWLWSRWHCCSPHPQVRLPLTNLWLPLPCHEEKEMIMLDNPTSLSAMKSYLLPSEVLDPPLPVIPNYSTNIFILSSST